MTAGVRDAGESAVVVIHISELRLEVRCSDARAMRALGAAWAPAKTPIIPTERTIRIDVGVDAHEIRFDGECLATASDPSDITPRIEGLIHDHLARWHPPPRTLFHAAAVSFGGQGYILSGPSDAGKSTLTRALVEAGATYFTDEVTVFGDGLVWGITRTPQLDPTAPGTPLPARYAAYAVDMESYRFEWRAGPRALPLMPLAPSQVARAPVPATSARVVIVRQGDRTRVAELRRTEAAAGLIDERRSETRTDLGPLFTRPPVALEWADPKEAAELLLRLSHE